MWIQSKVIPNARWEIQEEAFFKDEELNRQRALRVTDEMRQKDNEFIANLNPVLFCNDLTGAEWAFDERLPTGGYLENITAAWSGDGTRVFRALRFF